MSKKILALMFMVMAIGLMGANNKEGCGGPPPCNYEGTLYHSGDSFPSSDGCNKCSCLNGQVSCTEMACVKTCKYNGKIYKEGDSFPSSDGCNKCSCKGGAVVCTKKACSNTCGGIAGLKCAKGQVCLYPAGTCKLADGAGKCVKKVKFCPKHYQPVCGCDGKTYGNSCEALQAGVTVDYKGKCKSKPKTCGTRGGIKCQKGEYCRFDGGHCGATDKGGSCQKVPTVCPKNYLPVCGCDGKTYGNSCDAARRGVSVEYKGKCKSKPQKCNSDCDCLKSTGVCHQGTCQPLRRATICPQCDSSYCKPGMACVDKTGTVGVCSSGGKSCKYNGKIYKNGASFPSADGCNKCGCKNGQVVCTQMACPPKKVCGTRGGTKCQKGQYCRFDGGHCGATDRGGSCQKIPGVCPKSYQPVCGCDGKTYGNSCDAARRGVSVKYKGKCKAMPKKCKTDCDCVTIGKVCQNGICLALRRKNMCPQCGSSVCKPGMPCYNGKMGTIGVCPNNRKSCKYNGKIYADGASFPATDGCNKCGCQNGQVACTKIGCPPKKVCGTRGGIQCQKGQYCRFDGGHCGTYDKGGSCQPIPNGCTKHYAPVCGCNGKTYGNSCMAAAAGVSLKYKGKCNVAPKKCKSDCDCVTIGRACQSGVCAAVKRMNMCPQCGGPACKPGLTCFNGKTLGVCSSGGMSCKYNGKIYKNGASFPAGDGCNKCGCQNGQVVCTKMACPKKCGGIAGLRCSKGYACIKPTGTCNVADGMGTCVRQGMACTQQYMPVCGCNGKTYGNSCSAAQSGMSVNYKGKCKTSAPKCKSDCDCIKIGRVCHLGTCQPLKRMNMCPQCGSSVCKPGMPCYNGKMGTIGVCAGSKTCGVSGGMRCTSNEFCSFKPGTCGKVGGTCTRSPGACPRIHKPVCACNGRTYSNYCVANVQGQSVKHNGRCRTPAP